MPNPVLLKEDLHKLLLPDGAEKGPHLKAYNRILTSPGSEDLLTWNTFWPLSDVDPKSKWLLPFFRRAFGHGLCDSIQESECDQAQLKFWHGKWTKEKYYPSKEHQEWLKRVLEGSKVHKFCERARVGKRLEGATEVDLVIETPKFLTFVEAKYLADIDCETTNDLCRDQIIRNLDVGSYQARQKGKKFFFILLTPGYYQRSRLYWYKMKDYRESPDLIREKLPYLSIDFGELSRSIGVGSLEGCYRDMEGP